MCICLQQKVETCDKSKYIGLKINENKSKSLTLNYKENLILKANVPLETVEEFAYLDSTLSSDGVTTINIVKKINKARGILSKILFSTQKT